jgi:hypothetical protein
MPFEPNNTHGKGRNKGSENKTTSEIRRLFSCLIATNMDQLDKDLKSLTPFERVRAICLLAKYVVPIQKQVEITDSPDLFKPITLQINGIDAENI